jgi:hypothetical protein
MPCRHYVHRHHVTLVFVVVLYAHLNIRVRQSHTDDTPQLASINLLLTSTLYTHTQPPPLPRGPTHTQTTHAHCVSTAMSHLAILPRAALHMFAHRAACCCALVVAAGVGVPLHLLLAIPEQHSTTKHGKNVSTAHSMPYGQGSSLVASSTRRGSRTTCYETSASPNQACRILTPIVPHTAPPCHLPTERCGAVMLAPTPGCPNTSRILLIKHNMSTSGEEHSNGSTWPLCRSAVAAMLDRC